MENSVPPKALLIIPVSECRASQKQLLRSYLVESAIPQMEASPAFAGGKVQCLFVEQKGCHKNPSGFNVGAMRNAGYLYLKSLYPETDLSEVTLVFQDVDKFLLNYAQQLQPARKGKVDVYYFYTAAVNKSPMPMVGSVFAMTAGDFEKINGFPNIWGWSPDEMEMCGRMVSHGIERNYERCKFPGDLEIAHLQHVNGSNRGVNGFELYRFAQRVDASDGLSTLTIQSWTEDPAQQTLLVDGFTTANIDTPQHRTSVNLAEMNIEQILNRAAVWYQDAYMATQYQGPKLHAKKATAAQQQPFSWASREGIEQIQQHVKQFPRNRMQQLLQGGGGGI